MKDFVSCFSEHAVRVSDVSCSGSSSGGSNSSIVVVEKNSVQSAVSCLYRTLLPSSQKELLVTITWSKNPLGPSLSVSVEELHSSNQRKKSNAMNSFQLLRKKKGSRTFTSGSCVVCLFWDINSAKYASGPEPISDFYVVVTVDSELALLLGDMSKDYVKKLDVSTIPAAEFSMVGRKEEVLGHALYSTKARFRDDGNDHEITIRCKVDAWDKGDAELSVCVDNKRAVYVRRLGWNFRGNQTIFVDGSPVDMMWDVHGWWFSNPAGNAVFMFRARSALESRLWLEEEVINKEKGVNGFSLLIKASKYNYGTATLL
ncbi:uncharacterized protein [Typha latifolia]|uniref:uncharacterized protein n=1 Tax=Typha latifolia TaxID=4733 RepID=UPI003C2D056F